MVPPQGQTEYLRGLEKFRKAPSLKPKEGIWGKH